MRQVRWASWMVAMAMALALGGARPAAADVTSDRAAAILTWPSVIFAEGNSIPLAFVYGARYIETVIQMSNTSTEPVSVHCFYENANPHCTNTGQVCYSPTECCGETIGCGLCLPGWNETDFRVTITPRQPLGWLSSIGKQGFLGQNFPPNSDPPVSIRQFPLDGIVYAGIGGSSNAGSRIPPIPESPFIGSLRCIAVDGETGVPVDRNVLKGEATLVLADAVPPPTAPLSQGQSSPFDPEVILHTVAKHNAIGIQAIEGAVNDDNVLILGGEDAEYNGCPNYTILNHFFDNAHNPVTDQPIHTVLELVPCSQDYLRQIPGAAVVQYLVYNEFEQRFSTSRGMRCKQLSEISSIDTAQPERSIFSAGVGGTLTGQTRFTPLGSGLLAVAHERHGDFVPSPAPANPSLADFNLHFQGDRPVSDTIILP